VEQTQDGSLLRVQGLSELVRDTSATFYSDLDHTEALDPAHATVVADGCPYYRRARLWLESTLRKTPVPLDGESLTVSTEMLADTLDYQLSKVRKALDPSNLRTRRRSYYFGSFGSTVSPMPTMIYGRRLSIRYLPSMNGRVVTPATTVSLSVTSGQSGRQGPPCVLRKTADRRLLRSTPSWPSCWG
jgi:hypothetical protein